MYRTVGVGPAGGPTGSCAGDSAAVVGRNRTSTPSLSALGTNTGLGLLTLSCLLHLHVRRPSAVTFAAPISELPA